MNFGDSFKNFIYWEAASRDTIDFKKIYVDMTNDILAGLLLSQIIFWHLPNKTGDSKLRVQKEGSFWIAKSHDEWYEEIRFSRKNFDTAIKKLIQLNLVEKKIFKFDGTPTIHVRLLEDSFLYLWNKTLERVNKKEEEKPSESTPTLDLTETDKSVKSAPTLDLTETDKSKCPNRANGNDRMGQIFNRDYYRDYNNNELIDCNAHTRANDSIESNSETWKELLKQSEHVMIQDTVSLAQSDYLPEIHTMIEKHFPFQLDSNVIRIACELFSLRSYDFKNFKMKMQIENPIGFFRTCYVDAIKQYKLSLSKGSQDEFKGDSRRSTNRMIAK